MLSMFTVLYGNNPIYMLELFGSLQSIRCQSRPEDVSVTIFSDRDSLDDELPVPVKIIKITTDEWEKWTNSGLSNHFVKMYALEKFLGLVNGPVLYFDTDTIFTTPIEHLAKRISKETSLMHAHEGELQRHPQWMALLKHHSNDLLVSGKLITPDSKMFNSGIVGAVPEHQKQIGEAIQLAVEIEKLSPIFNVEQFATGYVLSGSSRLLTCEQMVLHYWGWRRKFVHIALKSIKSTQQETSLDALKTSLQLLRTEPTISPIDKLISRMRQSLIPREKSPTFAYLCYLSAIRNKHNTDVANAWVQTCIEMLSKGVTKPIPLLDMPSLPRYLNSLIENRPEWLSLENVGRAKKLIAEDSLLS